jgi:hypothetical protein
MPLHGSGPVAVSEGYEPPRYEPQRRGLNACLFDGPRWIRTTDRRIRGRPACSTATGRGLYPGVAAGRAREAVRGDLAAHLGGCPWTDVQPDAAEV